MATEKTVGAYLEITLKVNENDRAAAAAVYTKYRQPFLDTISGAVSKQLLVRGGKMCRYFMVLLLQQRPKGI